MNEPETQLITALLCGSAQSPAIVMIARDPYTTLSIDSAAMVAKNHHAVWQGIKDLPHEILATLHEVIRSSHGLAGMFGVLREQDEPDDVYIILVYPERMDFVEALQELEKQRTSLPSSLPTAFLAAQYALSDRQMMAGVIHFLAYIADLKVCEGVSNMSQDRIEQLVSDCIADLSATGKALEAWLPAHAVDRARFLLALGATCWEPMYRAKIAKRFHDYPGNFHIVPITWFGLKAAPTVRVSGMEISFARDNMVHPYPWLQVLEWDLLGIDAESLRWMAPDQYVSIPEPHTKLKKFSDTQTKLAAFLSQGLIAWIKQKQGSTLTLQKAHRIILPHLSFLQRMGLSAVHIHSSHQNGLWVGLEEGQRVGASFHWSPESQFPMHWLMGVFGESSCIALQLTLAALWLDLHQAPSPAAYARLLDGHWGTPDDMSQIDAWVAGTIADQVDAFLLSDPLEAARWIFSSELSVARHQPIHSLGLATVMAFDFLYRSTPGEMNG